MTQYFGPFLNRTPEWAEVFTNERTGKLKRVGDTMRRPSYGRTLREIGEKGSDVFYKVSSRLCSPDTPLPG
jgi:gamma-glutamyltranspeptidase